MKFISDIRSQLSRAKYSGIARQNHLADQKVLAELGLSDQFTADYTTTGTSGGDIAFLHDYIKTHRPRRVIEFGSGKSTWVIAKCMERYCWNEYAGDIRFVSMEESQYWYDELMKYFPREKFDHWDKFVKIICSETEIHRCKFIAGMAYKKTPIEHFDFCFVDGPDAPDSCNMDFAKLVASSQKPMTALVDKRKTTQIAYAALFGKEKMKRYHTGLCIVDGVSHDDLNETHYKDIFPEAESVLRF